MNIRFPAEAVIGTVVDFDRMISTVTSHGGQERRRDPQRLEVLAIPLAEAMAEERSLSQEEPIFIALEITKLTQLEESEVPAADPSIRNYCQGEFEKVVQRFMETSHLSVAVGFDGEFNCFFMKIDDPSEIKKIVKKGFMTTPDELARFTDAHLDRYEKMLGQIEGSPKYKDKIEMLGEYIGDLKRSRDDFMVEVQNLIESGDTTTTLSKTDLKEAIAAGPSADENPLNELYQALVEDLTQEGLDFAVPSAD